MYCRNCGVEISNGTDACGNCGIRCGAGDNYCQSCGAYTDARASACVKCGAPLKKSAMVGKSRFIAGILGILLGGLGAHNFYLGYRGRAWTQLLLSVLSCGVLAAVSSVWGIIEGIMILAGSVSTDANGAPLSE